MKSDGSIIISADVDNSKAAKKLNELEKKIAEVEREVEEKTSKRNAIEEKMNAADLAAGKAREKVKQLKAEIEQSVKNSSEAWGRGDNFGQAQEVMRQKEIRAEIERQTALMAEESNRAVKFGAELERADSALAGTTKKLESMKENAGELTEQITDSASATARMKEATQAAEKHMEKFSNRLKGLASRVLVFSLITKALGSLKDYMWKAIKANDEASAAVARLKGALLTLAQPIVNVVIPAFTALVNMLTRVVNTISSVVSGLFGSTVEQSASAAENLYNEQKALDGVGSSAKKAGKSLASFDEINQLSGDSEGGGGVGGGSSSTVAPDFSGVIQGGLDAILELFTGAALLAVGAILTFSGANVVLGIGLMAMGAAFIWDAITSDAGLAAELVNSGLDKLLQVVGPMVGILGVILIVAGHWGLGLGLLITGIALWAVGDAADDGGSFAENVKERLTTAAMAIGPLVAVLGVVLIVTGHLLEGLGLLITGIAIFAAASVAEQGDVTIEKVMTALGTLLTEIGKIAAVLGVILLVFGQIPTGLGLLLFGVAAFGAGEAALNFNELKTDVVRGLSNVLEVVGKFLFIIGLILMFVPGMMTVGFGMMVVGWGLLAVSAIAPNWGIILEHLKGAFSDIVNWWKTTVLGAFEKAKDAVMGFGRGIVGKLKDVLGIHSPSTETAEMGDYMMQGMANGITESQSIAVDAFQTVLDNLTLSYQTWESNFTAGFKNFRTLFSALWASFWNGINYSFTVKWNSILSALQTGVNNAITALNSLVDAANSLSGLMPGKSYNHVGHINVSKIPLPKLATGAVIPPNREFMAVLGDQKSGTNIETPMSTMVQAFKQAFAEVGYSANSEAVLVLDRETLGKVVYRLNREEGKRVGVNLAGD